MKRIIAVCFAGFLLFAGAASAATPAQRIASLEKQVKALTATVKKQQAVISCIAKASNKCVTLKSEVNAVSSALNATISVGGCLTLIPRCSIAVTADALQSTWTTLDQAGGTNLFGPQQTIGDADTCGPLQVTRQGVRNPPTTSAFSALTALLSRKTAVLRFG